MNLSGPRGEFIEPKRLGDCAARDAEGCEVGDTIIEAPVGVEGSTMSIRVRALVRSAAGLSDSGAPGCIPVFHGREQSRRLVGDAGGGGVAGGALKPRRRVQGVR